VWLGLPEDEEKARLAFEKIDYFDSINRSHIRETTRTARPWWWSRKPLQAGKQMFSVLPSLSTSDKMVFDRPGSPTHRAW
jgi:hypothetical protein